MILRKKKQETLQTYKINELTLIGQLSVTTYQT